MTNETGWHGNFLLPHPPLIFEKDDVLNPPMITKCLMNFKDLFWKLVFQPIESTENCSSLLSLFNDFTNSLRELISYPLEFLNFTELIFSSSFPCENVDFESPIPLYTALNVILSYIPGDENDIFCKLLVDLWRTYGTNDLIKANRDIDNLNKTKPILSIGDSQFIQSFICSLLPCLCWTYLTRTHLPPNRTDICHHIIRCCSLQGTGNSSEFSKHWQNLMKIDELDDFERENYIGIEQLLIFFAQNYSEDIAKGSFEFINIQSAHTPWSSGHYLPSILNKASLFIKKLLSTRLSTMLTRKEILQRYEAEHSRSSVIKGNMENNDPTAKDQQNLVENISESIKRQGSESSSSTEMKNFEMVKPNNRNQNLTGPLQILDSPLPSNMIPNFDDDPINPSASTEFLANIPFYPIRTVYAFNQKEIIKRCIGIYHSTIDVVLQRNSLPHIQIPSHLTFSPHKHPIGLFFAHFSYAMFSSNFLALEPIGSLLPRISPDIPYKDTRDLSKLEVDLKMAPPYITPVPSITEQIEKIAQDFPSLSSQSFGSFKAADLTMTLQNLIEEEPLDFYDLLNIETDPWKTGKQRLQLDDPLLMEIGLTLGLLHQRIFYGPTSSSALSSENANSSTLKDQSDITKNAIGAALKHGKKQIRI